MNKSLLFKAMVSGFVAGIVMYGILAPLVINADVEATDTTVKSPTLVANGHLTICKLDKTSYHTVKTIKMMVTAYSSTPDQTDDSPFITASGKHVEDGIVAINGLKFGTKVKIPALFGDKIFTVEDRMHSRKGTLHADVWMESRAEAISFGSKITNIEIVES